MNWNLFPWPKILLTSDPPPKHFFKLSKRVVSKIRASLRINLNFLGNYLLDHAENCDTMEEDSVDRLWLVVRSLKKPEGKYVS